MTKPFGFWTLTFLVIANMIGAAAFTTSGFAIQDLGSPQLVVWAWIVGGAIALSGAVSYGLLTQAMPESGGEYLFLSRVAHPLIGFVAGWVSFIAGFSGPIALAALAFEEYAFPVEIRPAWFPAGMIGVGAIVLAGLLHGIQVRIGAMTQNAVVIFKLGLIVIVLLVAAPKVSAFHWKLAGTGASALAGWGLVSAFAASLISISLSYSGFNAGVYVAGEVPEARATVPKALVAGTMIVTTLYVLLNIVFVYATPAASISGKADVAAITARALGGPQFELFLRGTIAVCLLTSVFSMLMAAPRVYAKMADDGMMPAFLRFKGAAPTAATFVQVAVAAAFVLVSNIEGLLTYLGLTLSLCAAGSVFCLFLPKGRIRPLMHPIHLFPAFYITVTLAAAATMTYSRPWQLGGTLLTFAVGAVVYVIVRYCARGPSPAI